MTESKDTNRDVNIKILILEALKKVCSNNLTGRILKVKINFIIHFLLQKIEL